MLTGTLYVVAALLLIAVLVTVHEFGHFLAARACGVHVKVFSIGIGGRAFGYRHKGTDYRVSWFPFGGYVRMAGADPFSESGEDDDEPTPPDGSFMKKPPWQRLIIVAAGPLMNLILPFVVFSVLLVAGEPQPRSDVGNVTAGSIAEQVGVKPEDRITAVNGTPVTTWIDVIEAFDEAPGDPVSIVVDRFGESHTFSLDYVDATMTKVDPWGFGIGNNAPDTTILVDDPASPATKAGLESGDRIVAIGGTEVRDLNGVRRLLRSTSEVRYARAGVEATATLTPDPNWAAAPTDADDALWRSTGIATATVTVASFGENAPAERAGIAVGDRILKVDETIVRTWGDVVRGVAAAAQGEGETQKAHPVAVTVRRNGGVQTFEITPDVVEDTDELGRYRWRPIIGVGGTGGFVGAPMIPRPYPVGQAVVRAGSETVAVAGFIVEQLGKLTTGEAAPQDSLGGPVEIFRQTRAAAERGIFDWARQMGLFSISLGIINFLPIPVLDGGQFLIYLAEWVRGRPLPLVLRERAQQAGVIFLVLLMLFVLVFDIHRAATG